MIIKIKPGIIDGEITAPPSKSESIRAAAGALLCSDESRLRNFSGSDDARTSLKVIEALGAEISLSEDVLFINGGLKKVNGAISCGESALCARLFSSLCALSGREIIITGRGSLMGRPMEIVEKGLRQFGVSCTTNNGRLPLSIKGPLKAGSIETDGSVSSQFISGLLFALPLLEGDSELQVKNFVSEGYINLTIDFLKKFGIIIDLYEGSRFFINGKQKYKPADVNIEGDWSGSAFILVAGALGGRAAVKGLNPDSYQPDRQILSALRSAGAEISVDNDMIVSTRAGLDAFEFDAGNCPDLIPPLAALGANCSGESIIYGADRLIHKESNRAAALQSEFGKAGVEIIIDNNRMIIKGGQLRDALVDSHNDHRIAMALAVAALNAAGNVEIGAAENVTKSYPAFFSDLDVLMKK